jgi:hypothetical protein
VRVPKPANFHTVTSLLRAFAVYATLEQRAIDVRNAAKRGGGGAAGTTAAPAAKRARREEGGDATAGDGGGGGGGGGGGDAAETAAAEADAASTADAAPVQPVGVDDVVLTTPEQTAEAYREHCRDGAGMALSVKAMCDVLEGE